MSENILTFEGFKGSPQPHLLLPDQKTLHLLVMLVMWFFRCMKVHASSECCSLNRYKSSNNICMFAGLCQYGIDNLCSSKWQYKYLRSMCNKNKISLLPPLDAAFVNFGLCQECFYLPEEFIANVQQHHIPPSIAANIFS